MWQMLARVVPSEKRYGSQATLDLRQIDAPHALLAEVSWRHRSEIKTCSAVRGPSMPFSELRGSDWQRLEGLVGRTHAPSPPDLPMIELLPPAGKASFEWPFQGCPRCQSNSANSAFPGQRSVHQRLTSLFKDIQKSLCSTSSCEASDWLEAAEHWELLAACSCNLRSVEWWERGFGSVGSTSHSQPAPRVPTDRACTASRAEPESSSSFKNSQPRC